MSTNKIIQALGSAAGSAGGAGLNVEDVFSTYVYDGTGSYNTITNGIDISTEGGLVWVKGRSNAQNNGLYDTERGANKLLISDLANAESTYSGVNAFQTTGFQLGSANEFNQSGNTYVSWTFRKAPKFFDVVTYTGNGTAGRTISHNLGSVPGCIIVKCRNQSGRNWPVYHRGANGGTNPEQYTTYLDVANGSANSSTEWNDTAPTDSVFTVGSGNDTNGNGLTYVAYLFAHNDGDGEFGPSGDLDVIKCGVYTGNSNSIGPQIDLGWEPQWVLLRRTDTSGPWLIFDSMRYFSTTSYKYLTPHESSAEGGAFNVSAFDPLSNGFQPRSGGSNWNASGGKYMYIAIRRGQMGIPTSADEVFHVEEKTNPNSFVTSDFVTDFAWHKKTSATDGHYAFTRLRGATKYLQINSNVVEGSTSNTAYYTTFDHMDGLDFNLYGSQSNDTIFYMFKRARGFFDVVTYRGDGVYGQTPHNLGVAPELMISRGLSNTYGWHVVHTLASSNNSGPKLDDSSFGSTYSAISNFTDTHFPKLLSFSGEYHVAYLFASLPGVSKVGTYTGTGASQTIDCGFSAGARFVLIKCTTQNSTPWLLFDSVRGITTGINPHLKLSSTDAQVSQDANDIEPDNSGFIVNSANNTNNGSGETYIFYAIA